MNKKSIIIAGPTASGKSGFAHELARRINGAIINCDSVQIYRDIETISASPFSGKVNGSFDEIDGVPYKLFSVLPLSEHISVADYLNMARVAMDEVTDSGRVPIFVGGSGYYINVLLNGIVQIPEIDEETRNRARDIVQNDINYARSLLPNDFDFTDPQRVSRALEVFLQTGQHITDWQKTSRSGALIPDAYKILLSPQRDVLLQRIAKRIPEMLKENAINEAQYIIINKLNETRAIGAEQLCKMLRSEISMDDAIQNWTIKTNQYAKRQRTWFKTQYIADYEINHVPTNKDVEDMINKVL